MDRDASTAGLTPSTPGGWTTFSPGEVIAGRHEVLGLLGRGGMGEVYSAYDRVLREEVALKTIRPELADGARLERFRREITLARRISHPNVCRMHDLGEHLRATGGGAIQFLTMELIRGRSLAERLRTGAPLDADEALPIVVQIARGLAAAHAAGVVHRDLKPANVMLAGGSGGPRVVLADFGLAIEDARDGAGVTGTGQSVGTPAYMAPEQVSGGGEVGPAADIYALGIVLYEMLTARLPFEADTPIMAAVKRLTEQPVPPRRHVPGLDARWERVIIRCLARRPEDRFSTPDEVVAALQSAGDEGSAHMLPRRRMLLWTGAGALGAAGWVLARAVPGARPGTATASGASRPALRVALLGLPASHDPHAMDDVLTGSVLWNVFEPLVRFDGDMKLEPALARAWHRRDGRHWTFSLRPALWHDGRRVGAADVVASLERARQSGSKVSAYLVGVREVRALDELTVEVETHSSCAQFLNKLAFAAILPRHGGLHVGTGPYRFGDSRQGQAVSLVAFSDYWGPKPTLPGISFVEFADHHRRRQALLSGEVDVAVGLSTADARWLGARAGLRVLARNSLTVAYLGVDCARPPFADRRVREALSAACDRGALVQELRDGFGAPTGQMVAPQVFGHDGKMPVPVRDVDRARRLLREAGWPGGVTGELEFRAGLDLSPLLVQFAEAGFRLQPRPLPWKEVLVRLDQRLMSTYFGGFLCGSGDASDLLDVAIHSPDVARGWGSANHFGYQDAALDAAIEASSHEMDADRRRTLLQALVGRVAAELPMIPLFTALNVHGAREGLDWTPRLDGVFRAADMHFR